MKYTVIGAGLMGSAAAFDLATRNPQDEIVLADINLQQAKSAATAIGPNVAPVRVDVNNTREIVKLLNGSGAVISAVSYSVNLQMTKAAIEAGVHMCDLGGNNEVVERQVALDAAAKQKGITVVPNCGLAPGLINILAVEGTKEFEELDSIYLRVGGLPQHPRPPLMYQIVFSVEGLINEYVEQATVIHDGQLMQVDPMSGLEDIEFPSPFGTLEAFNTSGGLSTLTQMLQNKVKNLDYKTIRYKGHCDKFKTLLDLGFATNEPMMVGGSVKTNREFFADLLRKKLDYGDKDVVLARATIMGRTKTAAKILVYEFVDYYDEAHKITAMMRTTAFPTSITAQMLAHGVITERGVLVPERCVPGHRMIEELGKRNLKITKKVTEVWD
ncbi:MAG: saccharopine dehydrogenase NADP-binding domain-containing protein [Ignavibacteriae bacterium]|nr:saccharopine dehydrogenase NADP-binding domain-containing protein [Ignavibacteriota bacterium]